MNIEKKKVLSFKEKMIAYSDYLVDPKCNPLQNIDKDPMLTFLITFLGKVFIQGYRILEKIDRQILILSLMEYQSCFNPQKNSCEVFPQYKIVSIHQHDFTQEKEKRLALYKELYELAENFSGTIQINILYLKAKKYSVMNIHQLQKTQSPNVRFFYQPEFDLKRVKQFKPIDIIKQGTKLHSLAEYVLKGAGIIRNQRDFLLNVLDIHKYSYNLQKVLNTLRLIVGKQVIQNGYSTISSQKWMRKTTKQKYKRFDLIMRNEQKVCIIDWKFSKLKAQSKILSKNTLKKNRMYFELARKDYRSAVQLIFYCIHCQTNPDSNHHKFSKATYEYTIDQVQLGEDDEDSVNVQQVQDDSDIEIIEMQGGYDKQRQKAAIQKVFLSKNLQSASYVNLNDNYHITAKKLHKQDFAIQNNQNINIQETAQINKNWINYLKQPIKSKIINQNGINIDGQQVHSAGYKTYNKPRQDFIQCQEKSYQIIQCQNERRNESQDQRPEKYDNLRKRVKSAQNQTKQIQKVVNFQSDRNQKKNKQQNQFLSKKAVSNQRIIQINNDFNFKYQKHPTIITKIDTTSDQNVITNQNMEVKTSLNVNDSDNLNGNVSPSSNKIGLKSFKSAQMQLQIGDLHSSKQNQSLDLTFTPIFQAQTNNKYHQQNKQVPNQNNKNQKRLIQNQQALCKENTSYKKLQKQSIVINTSSSDQSASLKSSEISVEIQPIQEQKDKKEEQKSVYINIGIIQNLLVNNDSLKIGVDAKQIKNKIVHILQSSFQDDGQKQYDKINFNQNESCYHNENNLNSKSKNQIQISEEEEPQVLVQRITVYADVDFSDKANIGANREDDVGANIHLNLIVQEGQSKELKHFKEQKQKQKQVCQITQNLSNFNNSNAIFDPLLKTSPPIKHTLLIRQVSQSHNNDIHLQEKFKIVIKQANKFICTNDQNKGNIHANVELEDNSEQKPDNKNSSIQFQDEKKNRKNHKNASQRHITHKLSKFSKFNKFKPKSYIQIKDNDTHTNPKIRNKQKKNSGKVPSSESKNEKSPQFQPQQNSVIDISSD